MDKKLQDKLAKKYPNIYDSYYCIECDDGWYDLIDRLSEKLSKLCLPNGNIVSIKAKQVKEKFGSLRYYYWTEPDSQNSVIWDIISEYEGESTKICQHCGSRENVEHKSYNWYIDTRCKKCDEGYNENN